MISGGQGHHAFLVALAENPHVGVGELKIIESESQNLTGTQTVQEHQAHQSEIAKGAKAAPEPGHFFGTQRYNHASRLSQAEPPGHGAVRLAVAERGSGLIEALEVELAGRNLLSVMKAVHTTQHAQAMIDGLRHRLGLLIQLVTGVIEQG